MSCFIISFSKRYFKRLARLQVDPNSISLTMAIKSFIVIIKRSMVIMVEEE